MEQMKEFFKQIRMEIYLSALLTIITGIVLIRWPMQVTGVIGQLLGLILLVMGLVSLAGYFMERRSLFSVAGGLVFVLLGVWIFIRPTAIVQLIPIFLGVVMLVHGIKDFQMAIEVKQAGGDRWLLQAVLALVSCLLGVVCVACSFGVVRLAVRFIGAALVYDGISDIWIAYHTIKAVEHASDGI